MTVRRFLFLQVLSLVIFTVIATTLWLLPVFSILRMAIILSISAAVHTWFSRHIANSYVFPWSPPGYELWSSRSLAVITSLPNYALFGGAWGGLLYAWVFVPGIQTPDELMEHMLIGCVGAWIAAYFVARVELYSIWERHQRLSNKWHHA